MRTSLTILIGAGLLAGSAWGDTHGSPGLSISVSMNGDDPISWLPAGTSAGGDVFTFDGFRSEAGMWSCDWLISADPDPEINSGLIFTNMTGSTQGYTVTVVLPIAPSLAGPTTHGGSFQGGVQDNSIGDSVIAEIGTLPGSAWYEGQIDGTTVLSFYPDPPGTSIAVPFDGGANNIPYDFGGLPGITLPSGPALSTISIKHTFTLTPNSTATLTGYFVVVPEPTTLGLLMIGGFALMGRRR